MHGDLCKHLGIDLSTDHPDRYLNLFFNAYINYIACMNPVLFFRAGVRTARILYTMAQCSGRFHPLITVVKTWGQVSRISRKGLGGGLSNFMLTMLVVHFLQSRSPPVLPAIKDMYRHDSK